MERLMTAGEVAELATLATEDGATFTLRGERVRSFAGLSDGSLLVTFSRGYACLLAASCPEWRSLVRQIHWYANGAQV